MTERKRIENEKWSDRKNAAAATAAADVQNEIMANYFENEMDREKPRGRRKNNSNDDDTIDCKKNRRENEFETNNQVDGKCEITHPETG